MRISFPIIAFLLAFLISSLESYSQKVAVEKGQSQIDVYYGFPNFYPTIIKQGYNNNFDLTRGLRPDYKVSNFNPIGIKYERMISNQIGIGLNLFYANSEIEWSDANCNYKSSVARYRIALSYNYHFSTTVKFDPYFIAHIGYQYVNYEFDYNYSINVTAPNRPTPDIKFDVPFTVRAGIGFRYYLTKNLGVNLEAGIGGPLLTGGFALKFK